MPAHSAGQDLGQGQAAQRRAQPDLHQHARAARPGRRLQRADRRLPGRRAQPDRDDREIRQRDRSTPASTSCSTWPTAICARSSRRCRTASTRAPPSSRTPATAYGDFEIKATVTIKKRHLPHRDQEPAADSLFHQFLRRQLAFGRLSRPDDVRRNCRRPTTKGSTAASRSISAQGHALQRGRAGAAHELHHDADGDADRRGAARLREGGAVEGRGVLGPRQRLQHCRLGHAHQRGICDDGAGDHHLGRRRDAASGRLARLRPGMLLRRADLGRCRAARNIPIRSSSTAIR